MSTVHALEIGMPLCRFSTELPGCWPADQRWVYARDADALDKVTCEGCSAALRETHAASYVLTRREMSALRDYWVEASVQARRDGDLASADANFQCAVGWDERSKR